MNTKRTLSWSLLAAILSMCSARCPDTSGQCLHVFTHRPASLPKCYCTDLCADRPERLGLTCASGELHADACGVCLECARALGQRCGGAKNVMGVCAGGLVCKVSRKG